MAKKQELQVIDPENTLSDALSLTKQYYPEMLKSSETALLYLSKIKQITTPEEDAYAAKILISCKNTYEKINGMRTKITSNFDALKTHLMLPEKTVSLDPAHKDSPALRVKKLRDSYAAMVIKKQQEDQAKIKADQAKKEERARLVKVFEDVFFQGVLSKKVEFENNVAAGFYGLKLEGFDESAKRFHVTPKLKTDYFESLFIVDYDKSKLSVADFQELLTQVKKTYTYDAINKNYVDMVAPILQGWKDKLPARKTELEELAKLDEAAQVEADKAQANKAEAERKERERVAALALEQQKEQSKQQQNVAVQDAAFEAQVATQNQEAVKNTKTTKVATITAPDTAIVRVLSEVLFACFSNPNFKGAYKIDKESGLRQVDESGRPIYHDWVEDLLSFYASSSDVSIEGVEIKEVISTIQRKTK